MNLNLQIPIFIQLSSFTGIPIQEIEEPQTQEDLELLEYPVVSGNRYYLKITEPSTDINYLSLNKLSKPQIISIPQHSNFSNVLRLSLPSSIGYGINSCYHVSIWKWYKVFNPIFISNRLAPTTQTKITRIKLHEEYWQIGMPYENRGSLHLGIGCDTMYPINNYEELKLLEDTATNIYYSLSNDSPLKKLFIYSSLLGYLASNEIGIEENLTSPGTSKLKVSSITYKLDNPLENIDNTIYHSYRNTKIGQVKEVYIGIPPLHPDYDNYTPSSPYLLNPNLDIISILQIVDYEGNIYLPDIDFKLIDTSTTWKPPLPERNTDLNPPTDLTPLYQIEWIVTSPVAYRIDYFRPLIRSEIVNRANQKSVMPNCYLSDRYGFYSI